MFAAKVANLETRGDASPTGKFAQRTPHRSWNEPRSNQRKAGAKAQERQEPIRRLALDFGNIPIFPPERPGRSPASSPLRGTIQRKLAVGQIDDPLKREADRVADQMFAPKVAEIKTEGAESPTGRLAPHRSMLVGDRPSHGLVEQAFLPQRDLGNQAMLHLLAQQGLTPPVDRLAPANLQAKITTNRRGGTSELKAKQTSESITGIPDVQPPHAPIPLPEAQHAGGQPLPVATRRRMQLAFGHDLSSIRIHADDAAARYTDRLGARAATLGADLFFNKGEFRPSTSEGERLIGHELAHVVQQAGGDRLPGGPTDPERAAEAAGDAVARATAIPFGLRATPARVPALQPKPGSAPSTSQPVAAKTWDERLKDAQAEQDLTKRSAAMTALAQEALGATYKVHEAGTKSVAKVDVADYAESPTINFDVRLNKKTKRDGKTPIPVDDLGWTLHVTTGKTTKSYPMICPTSLVVGQPITLKKIADHELYHAANPSAGELEAWTDEFTHYFLEPSQELAKWEPLIKYYEEVAPDAKGAFPARSIALAAISAFYQGLSTAPGSGTSKRSDKQRFEHWLIRRLRDPDTQNKALIKDLSSTLHITAHASAPATP